MFISEIYSLFLNDIMNAASFFLPLFSHSLALCWCGGRICLHSHPTYPHYSFCTHLEQELVSENCI